jgi:predicted PurR-regulated permease PerM
MKRVAAVTAVALATLLLAVVLWKLRGAAVLFLLSLVTAAALRPFVDGLERRGLRRSLALAAVYVVAVAVAAAVVVLGVRAAVDELDRATLLLAAGYERWLVRAEGWHPLPDLLLHRLPTAGALFGTVAGGRPEVLTRRLLGVTFGVVDVAGRFVVVVALSAYWSASRESFERLWLSLLPAPRRARARDVWRHVDTGVGAHLRSEIGQSLAAVLLLAGTFHYMHLPVAILPALLIGLLRLVPLVGAPAAVLTAFLAGSAAGTGVGVVAAGLTLAVIVTLDRLLARRLCRARRFSGTLTVLMVVALSDAYGLLGLVMAVPLGAAAHIFVERMLLTQPTRRRRADRLSDLEQRLSRLGQLTARLPPEETSEVTSLVIRLGRAVAQAKDVPELTPKPLPAGGANWELSPSTPMIGDPRH